MAKIHELLAVQGNLNGQATKVLTDLQGTLANKRHLFEEVRKTFQPDKENAPLEEIEVKTIQTTVTKELQWASKYIAKGIDIGYQIDIANSTAKADLVTEEGETLFTDVPATALLQLEHRVKAVEALVSAIPTLDPAKGFNEDPAKGQGYYKARDVRKVKTAKEDKPITIAKATEKHPEQAVLKTYDVPVGHILEQEWSGLITPAKKAELISQVEITLRAIKSAKAQANNVDVDVRALKIGDKLLEYIFKPLLGETT